MSDYSCVSNLCMGTHIVLAHSMHVLYPHWTLKTRIIRAGKAHTLWVQVQYVSPYITHLPKDALGINNMKVEVHPAQQYTFLISRLLKTSRSRKHFSHLVLQEHQGDQPYWKVSGENSLPRIITHSSWLATKNLTNLWHQRRLLDG